MPTPLAPSDWEPIERNEHDRIYQNRVPERIDVEKFLAYEDYCFKKGCRPDRGHRTRLALTAVGIPNLSGKRILDVGCGDGKYSVFLALHGARVDGFDISPVGIERAQALADVNGVGERCRFSVQNAATMDYEDDVFDVVFIHEALHHVIKYPGVHDQVLRVIRPGGRVIIAEGLYGNPVIALGRRISMHGQEAKGDVTLSLDQMMYFAKGFTIIEVQLMSLVFMVKRVFRAWVHVAPVRWMLYLVKRFDDLLLSVAPFMSRYCGECLIVLEKGRPYT